MDILEDRLEKLELKEELSRMCILIEELNSVRQYMLFHFRNCQRLFEDDIQSIKNPEILEQLNSKADQTQ